MVGGNEVVEMSGISVSEFELEFGRGSEVLL